jgi:hypothetical protein
MKVLVTALPDTVEGIYEGKDGRKDILPARMRYLHPDAAKSFLQADALLRQMTGHGIRVSDMLRSAESSLAAKAAGRGAARPGFSGHGYGLCIDGDIEVMLRRMNWSKQQLDEFMASQGWYCFRRDHDMGMEAWHYNYFGDDPKRWLDECGSENTTKGLEAKIQALYGQSFVVNPGDAQTALKTLRLYSGEADGILGPLSREAIRCFQRAWSLIDDGTINIKTQRTLAFVTSTKNVV